MNVKKDLLQYATKIAESISTDKTAPGPALTSALQACKEAVEAALEKAPKVRGWDVSASDLSDFMGAFHTLGTHRCISNRGIYFFYGDHRYLLTAVFADEAVEKVLGQLHVPALSNEKAQELWTEMSKENEDE